MIISTAVCEDFIWNLSCYRVNTVLKIFGGDNIINNRQARKEIMKLIVWPKKIGEIKTQFTKASVVDDLAL